MFVSEKIRRLSFPLAGIAVLALASPCVAQTSRVAGAVQGSVVDQTGSAVAGATVTLRNQGTNQTREISTDPEGSFHALIPIRRHLDDIYQWENHASSVYHGLSLSLNRRLANDIEFSGSYTLSKAIDDASDFNEQPENPYLLRAERASSSNDQRHRFVFSGTFDLLFGDEDEGKKPSGAIAKLFGNIEVAPILSIGSGRPINPLTGFDANHSGAFPSSSRLLGLSRNSLFTHTQVQLDLRVLKFFKVGEHGKLDFVVESFNLLNHTNVVALNQFYGAESSPIPVFATANKAGTPRQLQFSLDFEF